MTLSKDADRTGAQPIVRPPAPDAAWRNRMHDHRLRTPARRAGAADDDGSWGTDRRDDL